MQRDHLVKRFRRHAVAAERTPHEELAHVALNMAAREVGMLIDQRETRDVILNEDQ